MPRPLLLTCITLLATTTLLLSHETHPARPHFTGRRAGDRRHLAPGIPFRYCPPGTFIMGSPPAEWIYDTERPDDEDQTTVTLTRGFWLAETELTQGQWQTVMGPAPRYGSHFIADEHHPVSWVTPVQAAAFCEKLTATERAAGRLPPDWKYTLPTEAQWEYACRAGTTSKFSYGEETPNFTGNYDWDRVGEDAWYLINSGEHLHPVGRKKPNPWGLLDMHGNVSEWCQDWYAKKLAGGRDPQGPTSGQAKIIRGGSIHRPVYDCRSACRIGDLPGASPDVGFRPAAIRE